ncbi:MAG: KH domain-containing protein [Campylobacterales bacterium]
MIGKGGATIKRIGKQARRKIETLSGRQAYLDLFVSVRPNWTNDKKMLEDLGYNL